MKKIYRIIVAAILALSFSFPVHAEAEDCPFLTSGYTEEGVYYEIYGETFIQQNSLTKYAIRYVTYSGKVTPQSQIPWEETINEIKYVGTLSLTRSRYNVTTNKTTATYEGTLYVKE